LAEQDGARFEATLARLNAGGWRLSPSILHLAFASNSRTIDPYGISLAGLARPAIA
jgi:hypothetical protein